MSIPYGAGPSRSKTPPLAPELFRTHENPRRGVWEHRGKVAAAGLGHAPTARRWDGDPETSLGAWTLLAIERALADAGLKPEDVDGLVIVPDCSTGSFWPSDEPIPQSFLDRFEQTEDPCDGLDRLTTEWIIKNMPALKNVRFVGKAEACTSFAMAGAIQAVGEGLSNTCLVVKGWSNFSGRYYAGGENAEPVVKSINKYGGAYAGPASVGTALQFQRYLHKYGKSHDMIAPFVVNSKANGLLFPEGYWAQHRPEPLSVEDYLESRWIAKPANLFDNDIPIHTAAAYVITTGERARDLRQKPVYVLGHAGNGTNVDGMYMALPARSVAVTLEEAQQACADAGQRLLEAAGIRNTDVTFENMYDGFSLFHVFHMEGLGFAGIKEGEALDLFQGDISIRSRYPVSPSGGNIGSGRTRFWNHTDCLQQIRGTAGARQITQTADIGVAGGPMPLWSAYVVWSGTPD